MTENAYKPQPATILDIETLSPSVKLFTLKLRKPFKKNTQGLYFTPGQFVMAGEIGYGESPFGVASSPYSPLIKLCVRAVGNLTNELHRKEKGETLTVRGPYGNGFPIKKMAKKHVIMAAGGVGIPPIVPLVEYIIKNRPKFSETHLLYGAATPQDLLFRAEYPRWQTHGIDMCLTIDKPSSGWEGEIGFVSALCKIIDVDPRETVVVTCGPGPMMDAMEKTVHPLGVSDENIYISDERRLRCAIGKCQHCTTGRKYVCMDGPIFAYADIKDNWD
ncbi:MAG: FAD/NAD(P)-binding protein [Patescibacteria group bacterium]